jgi:hypothetical protein
MTDAERILAALQEAAQKDHRDGYPHIFSQLDTRESELVNTGIAIGWDRAIAAAKAAVDREAAE